MLSFLTFIQASVDKVDGPTLVLHIAEQWCVGCHCHYIRVALKSCHKGCLAHGTTQVALAALARHGILADEHLFLATLAVVVFVGIENKLVGIVVVVLVNHGMGGLRRMRTAPVVADDLHLGIASLDGI